MQPSGTNTFGAPTTIQPTIRTAGTKKAAPAKKAAKKPVAKQTIAQLKKLDALVDGKLGEKN